MDPYRELGVNPDASDEEIKSAYRALAKKYHPDANPKEENAAEKMNRINAAYAMLRGGSADLFLEEDWFQEQAENPTKRSILYHPTFRRVIVILIAASLAVVGIVSAFFSGLWPYLLMNSGMLNHDQMLAMTAYYNYYTAASDYVPS